MNFSLIGLTVILIISAVIVLFIFINKSNKKRMLQDTKQKYDGKNDDKLGDVNNENNYPDFSDQIHVPIILDRTLLEIEESNKKDLTESIIGNDENHLDGHDNDRYRIDTPVIHETLIRNSEFIF